LEKQRYLDTMEKSSAEEKQCGEGYKTR
jgi:hypothetical protein